MISALPNTASDFVLGCNSPCRRELTAEDVRAFYGLEFSVAILYRGRART
jgi:hypothetical protein